MKDINIKNTIGIDSNQMKDNLTDPEPKSTRAIFS